MPEEQYLEEATRYVLAELSQSENHRFEARMETSAELREQVRQLQEGALALALASRRRQPPPEIWGQIEKTLARETGKVAVRSVFRAGFWRSGWAAATACLLGWVLTMWHGYRTEKLPDPQAQAIVEVQPGQPAIYSLPLADYGPERNLASGMVNTNLTEVLHSRAKEIISLRWQVADLSNRMTHLSEAFRRQEALLSAPGQLTFFQLTPDGMPADVLPPVSTNLQRALFLAMARELGWVAPGAFGPGRPESEVPGAPSGLELNTNQPPVDFVDLPAGDDTFAQSVATPEQVVPSEPPAPPDDQASFTPTSVPGFVSGTNAVLAFDPSVVPAGTTVSFWTAASTGQFQSLGNALVGNNPVVVTVPFSAGSGQGGNLTVIAEGAGGFSNVFQVSPPVGSP